MERETGNRKDEGRGFLQAGRAQATAGINYKYKDTHQRIIQEEGKKSVRLKMIWNVDMQRIFLDILNLEEIIKKWNVDLQARAYLCSSDNNYVQYK